MGREMLGFIVVLGIAAMTSIARAQSADAGAPSGDPSGGAAAAASAEPVADDSAGGVGILAVPCTVACYPYASPSYCNYDCPTGHDYLIFGEVWTSAPGSEIYGRAGIGLCQFYSPGDYSKGEFVTYVVAGTNVVDYRVRADSTSASGGKDVVRLATPGSLETCRNSDATHGGVKIKGLLESADTFLFWGDGGDDRLYLCSFVGPDWTCFQNIPGASTCIANAGRADGRAGTDGVYGSVYGEFLWGSDGGDFMCGFGGNDFLYGGPNPSDRSDTLEGGGGSDWLEGGTGDSDVLIGDGTGYPVDGDDYLYGDDYHGPNSGSNDRCFCYLFGDSGSFQYCNDANCEVESCVATCP